MPHLLFADAVQVAVLQALAWTLYGGGHAVLLCAAWTRKQPEDATWQDRASAPGLGLIASALVSGVQVRVRQQTCHGMYYYWPVALDSGSLAIVAEVGGPSASQDEIASAFAQPNRQRSYDLEGRPQCDTSWPAQALISRIDCAHNDFTLVQALEKAHSEGSLLHALTLTLYVGYIAIVAVVQLVKLLIFLTSCAYASVCTRFSGGRNVAAAVGGGFDGLSAAADGGGGGGATAADGDSSTQPRAPHIAITMRDFVAAGADSAALEALAAGGGGGSGSSGGEHYGCAGDVASSPARGRGNERATVVTRLRSDSHGCTATAVDAVCGSPAAKRLQRLSASRPPLPHSMATPGGAFACASGSLSTAAVVQGALAAGSAVQRRGGGSPPAAAELSNEPLTPTAQLHSSPGAAGAAATPVAQSPNSNVGDAPGTGGSGSSGGGREAHEKAE